MRNLVVLSPARSPENEKALAASAVNADKPWRGGALRLRVRLFAVFFRDTVK